MPDASETLLHRKEDNDEEGSHQMFTKEHFILMELSSN